MLFLGLVLAAATALLCYAGYVFLIVDKREAAKEMEEPELFEELDMKEYFFELPEAVDTFEELRATNPSDKRTLPMALLNRAKADIPLIEQLEKDHPRMARLFNRGLLPNSVWEQLLDAEACMDTEVHDVQAEAEKLQKGWGQGVFGQAYQILRKEREQSAMQAQAQANAAVLSLEFTKLSGGVVKLFAEGRAVGQQTQMVLRGDCLQEEVAFKTEVFAELEVGTGDESKKFSCRVPELLLDKEQDKQWKQIGSDSTALRLQVKFVRRANNLHIGFGVADIRATIPLSGGSAAAGGAAAAPPPPDLGKGAARGARALAAAAPYVALYAEVNCKEVCRHTCTACRGRRSLGWAPHPHASLTGASGRCGRAPRRPNRRQSSRGSRCRRP